MREEFDFHFSRLGCGDRFAIAGEEGADRFFDLAIAEKAAAASIGRADIVGDLGRAIFAGFGEGVE